MTKKKPIRTKHYWAIHRKVAQRELRLLDRRTRSIIALDEGHDTPEYREFERRVNTETELLYKDPDYYYNDKYTFRRPWMFDR